MSFPPHRVSSACPAVEPLLRVANLGAEFGGRVALRGVSFDLFAGETVGLVGESGSGKSTLARAILRLIRPSSGSVLWRGRDLLDCEKHVLRRLRRDLQIVFQDPLASLNPRMTVGAAIAEPLRIFEPELQEGARRARVAAMLERVGLTADMIGRYPHEFSGGQCQRIGIARAMILNPKLLICDEPVSSLDVSIQGQIINLLLDLQRDSGTAMLFISHNLAVVRHISHRILVMYKGALIETAASDVIFSSPVHPYTRALLAAVPSLTPGARIGQNFLLAEARTSEMAPAGCAFRSRCPCSIAACAAIPQLSEIGAGHAVACHRSAELAQRDLQEPG